MRITITGTEIQELQAVTLYTFALPMGQFLLISIILQLNVRRFIVLLQFEERYSMHNQDVCGQTIQD